MIIIATFCLVAAFLAGVGIGLLLNKKVGVNFSNDNRSKDTDKNSSNSTAENNQYFNFSNRTFLLLANSLPTYLVIIKNDGTVLFVNETFKTFIGDNLPTFKINWLSFVSKNDVDRVKTKWRSAVKSNQSISFEYRFDDGKGLIQHIETFLTPITNPNSGEIVWFASSINNSKLEDFKNQLEQLAAKREGILQNMEDGFISVTEDLFVDYVNFRAEIMLQLPQNCIGMKLKETTRFFEEPDILAHIKYALNNTSSDNFEFSYKGCDYFIRIYPTATGLSFYFQDITSEKSSRNELKLLRTAIDKANDVVLITTAELEKPGPTVVYANEAFERVTGYSRQDIIGQSPRLLQGKETERKNLDVLKNALQSSEPVRVLLTNYSKDGQAYFNEVDISPIIDKSGVTTHFVAIERDISKQKEQEDLAFRAHKMDSIGLVTGGVAHDFNNLLTIILGNCEILSSQLENQNENKSQEYLNAISDATRQGVSLTRSLLAFSKRQPFNKNTVVIDNILTSVVPLIKTALGAQFEFTLSDECSNRKLAGDHAQLESMFLNMAINARDAMDGKGSFSISIKDKVVKEADKLSQYLNPANYTLIQFKDSGKGMTPEVIDKIFDPFFSTKALTKGTGLGLSMIYSYVDQCSGYIAVESKINQGTTFNVYLPAGNTVENDQDKQQKLIQEQDLVTDFTGKTVLITEDTQMVAKVACHIFNELGFNVLLATDGLEALDLFEENPQIDLLFTDIILPNGLTGKDVANRIKESVPTLPVIFTSGFTDGKLKHDDYQTTNTEFLQKPYTKKALVETVNLITFS